MSREDLLWNPEILYHYTTREGLLGILRSRTVWATSIRFLNDASEYTYAQSKFIEKLREIRQRISPMYSKELDEAIRHLGSGGVARESCGPHNTVRRSRRAGRHSAKEKSWSGSTESQQPVLWG
jgi:hypothetical protein